MLGGSAVKEIIIVKIMIMIIIIIIMTIIILQKESGLLTGLRRNLER